VIKKYLAKNDTEGARKWLRDHKVHDPLLFLTVDRYQLRSQTVIEIPTISPVFNKSEPTTEPPKIKKKSSDTDLLSIELFPKIPSTSPISLQGVAVQIPQEYSKKRTDKEPLLA